MPKHNHTLRLSDAAWEGMQRAAEANGHQTRQELLEAVYGPQGQPIALSPENYALLELQLDRAEAHMRHAEELHLPGHPLRKAASHRLAFAKAEMSKVVLLGKEIGERYVKA